MTASTIPQSPLSLELLVSPPHATMAERNTLEIGLRVTNRSDHTIEPHLHLCKLLVDGLRSMVFSGAVGNGMRPHKWRQLPAGENVQQSWALGQDLFDHPGDYTLELELEGVHSAPVQVHIDP